MTKPADPVPPAPDGPKYDGSNWGHVIGAGVVAALIGAVIVGIGTVWWFSATKLFAQLPPSIKPIILALETPAYVAIVLGGCCFIIAFFLYFRRYGLWEADGAELDALRDRVARGESAGAWYANKVRSALSLTDRFFGDAGKVAPLWTAKSYDTCLLMALLYPLICIYAVWAITGQAGDAGAALGLIDGERWVHIGRVAVIICIVSGIALSWYKAGWMQHLGLACAVAAAVAGLITGAFINASAVASAVGISLGAVSARTSKKINTNGMGIVNVTFALSFAAAAAGDASAALALAFAVSFVAHSAGYRDFGIADFLIPFLAFGIFAGSISLAFVYAGAIAWIIMIVGVLSAGKWGAGAPVQAKVGLFHWIFSITLLAACLLAPLVGGSMKNWPQVGALLYFLTLLTLINAAFDWVALGITRALLRKGLEQGGLSPLGWGFVDLAISLFTVALLGVAVLMITQFFNAMSVLGGAATVAFDPLLALRGIADPARRFETQYYWLYLMLLTTQLPAILNLAAGFLSVIRTRDWGNGLVRKLAAQGAGMGIGTRLLLASVQAPQVALAVMVGFFALILIYYGIIKGLEPLFGGTLLSGLLWLAEANWPAQWFGV